MEVYINFMAGYQNCRCELSGLGMNIYARGDGKHHSNYNLGTNGRKLF